MKQLGKYTESTVVYKKQHIHHQTGYIPKISFVQLQLEKLSWRQRLGKMSSLNECTFKRGRTPCSLCPPLGTRSIINCSRKKRRRWQEYQRYSPKREKKACTNRRVKVHTEPRAFPTDALSGPPAAAASYGTSEQMRQTCGIAINSC